MDVCPMAPVVVPTDDGTGDRSAVANVQLHVVQCSFEVGNVDHVRSVDREAKKS